MPSLVRPPDSNNPLQGLRRETLTQLVGVLMDEEFGSSTVRVSQETARRTTERKSTSTILTA